LEEVKQGVVNITDSMYPSVPIVYVQFSDPVAGVIIEQLYVEGAFAYPPGK